MHPNGLRDSFSSVCGLRVYFACACLCKFQSFPFCVSRRNPRSLLKDGRIQDLKMGSKAEKKVVIVGKYCAGKTALVNRFTKNTFNQKSPYQPVSISP